MDHLTLKKKLSSYESEKGYLKNVSEDILYEVLVAWENWTGPAKDFYRSLGFTSKQMASIIGKAKKLKREGYFGSGEFKAVKIEGADDSVPISIPSSGGGIEIVWKNGSVIRFAAVEQLVDFLKKAA